MFRYHLSPNMKERDELLDQLGIREAILVHYDIRKSNVRARTTLDRFLFGRLDVKAVNGGSKTYRYPGLAESGAEWIGQSVFLLEPDLGDRLIAKLRVLGIRHWARTIYVPS